MTSSPPRAPVPPLVDGSQLIRRLPFLDEGPLRPGELTGSGLEGRLGYDLAQVAHGELVVPTDRFYVRTRWTGDVVDRSSAIAVVPATGGARELFVGELDERCRDLGAHLLECAGNSRLRQFGLMSSARWSGAPALEVLDALGVTDRVRRVLIVGGDGHLRRAQGQGASWIFAREQLADAFFATGMNDRPLTVDHGAPCRLFVPGWYGCCSIKWVSEIRSVADDAPATPHMRDYASRTHQNGEPALARDYAPAVIDDAAMPVLAQLRHGSEGVFLLLVGVLWGGNVTARRLEIRLGAVDYRAVDTCLDRGSQSWNLWWHVWRVPTDTTRPDGSDGGSTETPIDLRIVDAALQPGSSRGRRLRAGHYTRSIRLPTRWLPLHGAAA